MESRRVALYVPFLEGGGAERIMVTLANAFAERGIRVDLVLARDGGAYFKDIFPDVRIVHLKASRAVKSLPGLIRYLVREKPDGLMSTLRHANIIAACAHFLSGTDARLVLREASHFSLSYDKYASFKDRIIRHGVVWAYKYADRVVCLSEEAASDLVEVLGVGDERIVTIYNPALNDNIFDLAKRPLHNLCIKEPIVLGVGRLVPEKDFSTLLYSFARVRKKRKAHLLILGEGPERAKLRLLARELGVDSDMSMPGFVDNPFTYMRAASVLVLSSKWEGFGNVLVEAMACDTPVVATDCPGGPAEILESGRWGKLVPVGNSEEMARAVISTLDERPKGARARAMEFHVDKIANKYERILFNEGRYGEAHCRRRGDVAAN